MKWLCFGCLKHLRTNAIENSIMERKKRNLTWMQNKTYIGAPKKHYFLFQKFFKYIISLLLVGVITNHLVKL